MKKAMKICAVLIFLVAMTACQPMYIFYPVDSGSGSPEKPEVIVPTNPWGNKNKVFYDDFSGNTAVYYCPQCAKEGNMDNHASHVEFSKSFVVENGKATVYGNSAYIDVPEVDSSKKYTLTYTVELADDFGDGDILLFNFGETTGWNGVFAGFYGYNGNIKITSQNSEAPTEFNENVSVAADRKYTISFTAGPTSNNEYEITASVNGIQISTVTATSMDELYWDIYYPTAVSDSVLGYISDFSITAEEAEIPMDPWGNKNKVFYDDFSGNTAVYYCPQCAKEGNMDNHASHVEFSKSFVVENGKATVYGNSAYIDVPEVDSSKKYTLTYTVELADDFGDGDILLFNFGETTGWNGVFAGFYGYNGNIKITSQNSEAPTEFNENVSVAADRKYTISFTAGPTSNNEYEITASVNGIQISTVTATSMDELYWDIYYPTAVSGSALGYISDFSITAE